MYLSGSTFLANLTPQKNPLKGNQNLNLVTMCLIHNDIITF